MKGYVDVLRDLPWLDSDRTVLITLRELVELETRANGGPVFLSTPQAEEFIGRTEKWWRERAQEGKIEGAFRDPHTGRWVLRNNACRTFMEELERKHSPTPRRFYGPRRKRPRVQPTGAPPS